MTRINTNVSSLVAQNRLSKSNVDLQTSLTRLSTGLRINSGKDDPAGLIASEALRSDITSLNKSISNTNRASQIIATADSALGQVSSLLNDIRGLVVEAANTGALSDDEIAANQLQVDSSLEAINRIAQTTTFQGRKLLDGSLDFISDLNTNAAVTDYKIDQANLGASGSVAVDIDVSTAASKAELTNTAIAVAAAANASTGTAKTASFAINGETIALTGPAGLTSVAFATSVPAGGGTASYDTGTGVLTITADFGVGQTVSAIAIQAAINGIDGLVATGATAAGTAAAAPSAPTVNTVANGLKVTAVSSGKDYNDVTVAFASGAANAADYDTTTKTLTVTINSAAPQTAAALASKIASHTIDGAAGTALFSATGGTGVSLRADDLPESINTGYSGGEQLTANVVFELVGTNGSESFNFQAGSTGAQIAAAINLVSDATGVASTFVAATGLKFSSSEYGSDAKVAIDVISEGTGGIFESSLSGIRSTGGDIEARVNGIKADGKGSKLSINTSTLDLSVTLDPTQSVSSLSFTISGGGAKFQLGGDVVSNQQARLGIGSVSTSSLGGSNGRLYELGSGQSKALADDANGAAKIIDEVINKVASLRGRLGAFQATTLESNLVSLGETVANLTEAESSIRDADFAAESARLTRAQILVQSGTAVLGIANQNPQNVLSLLR